MWIWNFNLNQQQQTNTQVRVHTLGLTQEYWTLKIIYHIDSRVGTPICMDINVSQSFFARSFGHYARILVDVDLSCQLREKILVERNCYSLYVDIEYEKFPNFCNFCKNVGYSIT